jgi:hypothetical protein
MGWFRGQAVAASRASWISRSNRHEGPDALVVEGVRSMPGLTLGFHYGFINTDWE